MTKTPWRIEGCTVADGAALAHNNFPAFWTDPTWRVIWPMCVTPKFVITQGVLRGPRNLLRDRATLRHQKAVDPATGGVVGYARWILPPSLAGDAAWPEAQVPDVSDEEKAEIERVAETAWWHFNDADTALDIAMSKRKNEMLAEREYLGEFQGVVV